MYLPGSPEMPDVENFAFFYSINFRINRESSSINTPKQ
ncbi:MAG: hypothetical protein OJF59_002440 [Cytophagales bacterium]|nr:MAG: hypothetical protein OJF59_002440 [Cytophagales bacterium]